MKFIKKNRLRLYREDKELPEPENEPVSISRNRIKGIQIPQKKSLAAAGAVVVLIILTGALLYLTDLFRKKPQLFKSSKKEIISEPSGITETFGKMTATDNSVLRRGIENYLKGYHNNAVSDFMNVIESGSDDRDKAVAYMYLGMIYDDKGNYDQALENLKKAVKYDDSMDAIFRQLAIVYRHKKDYNSAADAAKRALKISPKNAQNYMLLGNIYYEQGKYKDAISSYEQALSIGPDDPSVLHNIGLAFLKTGDEMSGIEYLKRAGAAGKAGNSAFLAFSKLGAVYLDRNEYGQAEKYLKDALAIKPDDPAARYNLGLVYMNTNRQEEALAELTKAEEVGGNDELILENLGQAYSGLNDFDRSIKVYNRILENNRRNVRVLSKIAEIYRLKGEPDKAYEIYKKITVMEPASENARIAYGNMGNLLDDLGRSDDAVEAYANSLAIGEDDSIRYNQGIAYKNAGKTELAIQSWRKAADLNSDNPKPRIAIADLYNEKGFTDLAIEEYEKIVKRWGYSQDAYLNLALLYYKKNLFSYSEAALKSVIEINDSNEQARKAYVYLGKISLKTSDKPGAKQSPGGEDRFSKAQEFVQKALLIKPNDPEALIILGNAYYKEAMYDKAIETYYLAVSSSKSNSITAEAYNDIGKSYHRKGDYKNALKAFTSGIEFDPSSEELRINRKASAQAYEATLD